MNKEWGLCIHARDQLYRAVSCAPIQDYPIENRIYKRTMTHHLVIPFHVKMLSQYIYKIDLF